MPNKNLSYKPKNNKRSKAVKKGWNKRRINNILAASSSNNIEIMPGSIVLPSTSKDTANETLQSLEFLDTNENLSRQENYSDNSVEEIENLRKNPLWCKKTYRGPGKFSMLENICEPGVIPSDEYECIMETELTTETVERHKPVLTGNRIVELGYVIEKVLSIQANHLRLCTMANLYKYNEISRGTGLVRTIELKCRACEKVFSFCTENPNNEVINIGCVWGTLAAGSSYTHTNELLSSIDIPPMPQQVFTKYERQLSEVWNDQLWSEMVDAGHQEKEHAISLGNICSDGIPWVTVYVDGSWSKRSYGTNFNALSGMVGIIGKHTGQLLYIAVRNKYCSVCARANNKGMEAPEHVCFKNWSGSTTGMEADMVVEGFCKSEEMHGVRYCKFIADGDSSVYVKIKERVPYGQDVKKVECTNHAIKNYGKHLRAIKKDTNIDKNGRKLLTEDKIKKLSKRAQCSIYEHSRHGQDVTMLKLDLQNGLHHVYGDHSQCREGICNSVGEESESKIELLKQTNMYNHLKGNINLLTRKAHLLIENENNNAAERLMNLVARFNTGKRLNFVQRGSYKTRVCLSGLRYHKLHNWSVSSWKRAVGRSPGKHFKQFVKMQNDKHISKVKKRLFYPSKKRSHFALKCSADWEYGLQAEEPFIEQDTIATECQNLLNDLQVSTDKRNDIARLSTGQFGNNIYEAEREKRLTASLFGRVINRKPYTSCHGIVKACLKQNKPFSLALEYGVAKESVAIALFESKTNLKVQKSGLWIDLQHGFLAASPDGIIADDALVEVKCLYSCSNYNVKTITEVLQQNKKTCLIMKNGQISLKKKHPYYFQIQGQLNILHRSKCYFVVYVNDSVELYIEEIRRDEDLWTNIMLPKLSQFYTECIAPEIIRDCLGRNNRCIDPPFILEAIQIYEEAKKRNISKTNTSDSVTGNKDDI